MSKNRQKQGENNPQKHESCARGCGASRDSLRHPPFATLSVDFIEQILGISRGLASEIRQCSFEIMHKNYKTQIKLLVEAVKLANKRKKRGVAVQKFIMAHDAETTRLMAQCETHCTSARNVALNVAERLAENEAKWLASEIRQIADEIEAANQGTTDPPPG